MHRPTTADQMAGVVRRYIDPHLGGMRLAAIQPADIQRWVKQLSHTLAPSTVGVAHRILSGILKSAVADRRIVANPCTGTKLPKVTKPKVQPITEDQLAAIVEHMPRRHQALVILAAGTGLRQGEIFGLTVDRLDLERRTVLVDRQLINVNGREPFFGPPKSQASVRVVPLPSVVADALRAHLQHLPLDHPRLHQQRRRPAAPVGVLDRVEPSPQAGRRPSHPLPRAEALLRLATHPSRRVGQDRPGAPRPRQRQRDARHLQPPLARQRRAHQGRRRRSPPKFCGLIADQRG